MGLRLSSERGRYSQSLTLLTIEPNTFLPFQISWAVLGHPVRLRRDERIRRELRGAGGPHPELPADVRERPAAIAAPPGSARALHESTAARVRGIPKVPAGEMPKFCRELHLEFVELLGGAHHLYEGDADLAFLPEMRRAAVLCPPFRRACIESRRVLPVLIGRLIRCLDCINERSARAADRYRRLMMTAPRAGAHRSLGRWTALLVRLEKRQVRRQMLALFDAVSAILQDSEGIKARVALVEDGNASYGGDNLLTLIDVCFEYRTSGRASRPVAELRRSRDRERSLFVPQATFDEELNAVDEEFTLRFVEVLFQTFSIYQHAHAMGLVGEFNFLNPLMDRVRATRPRAARPPAPNGPRGPRRRRRLAAQLTEWPRRRRPRRLTRRTWTCTAGTSSCSSRGWSST